MIFLIILFMLALFSPIGAYKKILGQFFTGEDVSSGRIAMWKEALRLIKQRPLFGHGLAGYSAYADSPHLHAHNTYLELFAETGVLGL
ncbi:MAG: O-antigen ligase family protein, partial [Candidatus Omnitrophica bacterium]|nr:O-antigen ligase family protein [Candidatus Omnitrophota bacterium]